MECHLECVSLYKAMYSKETKLNWVNELIRDHKLHKKDEIVNLRGLDPTIYLLLVWFGQEDFCPLLCYYK